MGGGGKGGGWRGGRGEGGRGGGGGGSQQLQHSGTTLHVMLCTCKHVLVLFTVYMYMYSSIGPISIIS